MINITDFVSFVRAYSTLSALQSTRLYPIRLPQQPTLPASTYMVVDNVPQYSQSGLSDQVPRIQVDCYGSTYGEAHALANAYVSALADFKFRYGVPAFLANGPTDLPDDPELDRSRVSFDVTFGQ